MITLPDSAYTFTGNNSSSTYYALPTYIDYTDTSTIMAKAVLISTGEETALTNGVDFTVDLTNGALTTAAWSSSYNLVFWRETPNTQTTDLSRTETPRGTTVESGMDRIIRQVQEVAEKMNRAIMGIPGETLNSISSAVARAGNYLFFNSSSGQPEERTTAQMAADVQEQLSILSGATADEGQKRFADASARASSVPDRTGQIGVQLDTNTVWISTGTSAGNWTIAHGAIFEVSGSSLTLSSDHNRGSIYLTGTGTITVTIPAGLDDGFQTDILVANASTTVNLTTSGGATVTGTTSFTDAGASTRIYATAADTYRSVSREEPPTTSVSAGTGVAVTYDGTSDYEVAVSTPFNPLLLFLASDINTYYKKAQGGTDEILKINDMYLMLGGSASSAGLTGASWTTLAASVLTNLQALWFLGAKWAGSATTIYDVHTTGNDLIKVGSLDFFDTADDDYYRVVSGTGAETASAVISGATPQYTVLAAMQSGSNPTNAHYDFLNQTDTGVSSPSTSGRVEWIYRAPSNEEFKHYHDTGGTVASGTGDDSFADSSVPTADEWMSVSVKQDATDTSIEVNGTKNSVVAAPSTVASLPTRLGDTEIAGRSGSFAGKWIGMWDAAITDAEIDKIHANAQAIMGYVEKP